MKNRFVILSLVLFSLLSFHATSQQDSLVRATIDQLFKGMRDGDSLMVRNAFYDEVSLKTCYIAKTGETIIREEQLIDFLEAVGTPREETWDEQIHDVEIRIDDRLAMAWVPYRFYLDNFFSHEGVNIFELVFVDNQWKITSIFDTRRIPQVPKE